MKFRSIRWRLPLSYALIALIAALAMETVLVLTLRNYYRQQERAYQERNALAISAGLGPLLDQIGEADALSARPSGLDAQLQMLALLSQSRVRLYGMDGQLQADSGQASFNAPLMMVSSVNSGDTAVLADTLFYETAPDAGVQTAPGVQSAPGVQPAQGIQPAPGDLTAPGRQVVVVFGPGQVTASTMAKPVVNPEKLQFFFKQDFGNGSQVTEMAGSVTRANSLVSVVPVSATMYGFNLEPDILVYGRRSSEVVRRDIVASDGRQIATIEVSEGPSYGSEIVSGVMFSGGAAGVVAVLIAAAAGWWTSRKMSAPLLALTGSTRQMAAGDLSTRASVSSRDEIGALAASFNEMAGRIEEMVGGLRRFASDSAHELQTPLTALQTNLELADDVNNDEERQMYVRLALEQTHRLEALTSDLLDLSRIESGAGEENWEEVDLKALFLEQCEPYASRAEQAGQAFQVDVPDGPVSMQGSPGQVRRALANLLDNALKFTPPGGEIRARLEAGNEIRMVVEDNGAGILAEDVPFLFQRFHRGRNVAAYPGSGLGLAIVQAVAEHHGGRVYAEPLQPGTRFVLVLVGRV